jgi:hypothetical protein
MLGLLSSKKTGQQSQAQLINGAARFHQMRDTRGPRSGGPGSSPCRLWQLGPRVAALGWLLPQVMSEGRGIAGCGLVRAGGASLQRRFHMLGRKLPATAPACTASRFGMLAASPDCRIPRWPLLRVKFHGIAHFHSRSLTRNRHMHETNIWGQGLQTDLIQGTVAIATASPGAVSK